MISIKNEQGQRLELFASQNLVTEQAAAWLVDDELPGEFSYPIDVPLTENNKRFVAHGYRPDAAAPRLVLPVTVAFGGVLYRRALLAYKLQNGKLNAYLKIDSAEAYDKLRKVTLQDAFSTPVKLGDGLQTVSGVAKLIPLNERLGQIAGLAPGSFPAAFFPIRNELFFESDITSKVPSAIVQPYVNCFTRTGNANTSNFVADYSFGTGTVRGYPICPQLHLWWVLTEIMRLAGFRIESDWLAIEAVQRLCILNLTAMPVTASGLINNLTSPLTGHSFVPGLCLPELEVADFLKAIKQRFGLCFTFNANTRICRISQFLGSVAAGPLIDLTRFQSGRYDTAEPDGRGFAVSDFIDSNDELYKDAKGELIQPAPLITGKGGQAISLKVGSCQSIYTASPLSTGKWQVPTLRQAGNLLEAGYSASDRYLDQNGKRRNPIGLRLVSYEGMQPDSTGALYPFASTESSELSGRNGIWRKGLRQYYYFRDQTQKITQPLLLPATVLSGLRLDRSVSLSLSDQIRRSYLVTKLQAEAPGPDGKLTARIECQTLPAGLDQAADVDEPLVYLELIQDTQADVQGPLSATVNVNTYDLSKLTVKVWADRNRSKPAVVGSLPVRVRTLKSWPQNGTAQKDNGIDRTVFYQEYVSVYAVQGSQTVIEDALKTKLFLTGADNVYDWHSLTLQLDPGEGYAIL